MERLSLLLLLLLEAQAERRQWSASLSFQLSGAPPGTRVGSGHADVGLEERTGCSHPTASTHPSDTSPMPGTVLGATRSSGDVAQEEV